MRDRIGASLILPGLQAQSRPQTAAAEAIDTDLAIEIDTANAAVRQRHLARGQMSRTAEPSS